MVKLACYTVKFADCRMQTRVGEYVTQSCHNEDCRIARCTEPSRGGGVKELDVWLKIVGMHASAGAVYPQWEKEMV